MRIRSIKPEFWRSDDIDQLDWHTRLLFIGLWSYVDDNGVGRDRDPDIVADLFAGDLSRDPLDTLSKVSEGLRTLFSRGLITRYTVAGKPYLHITAWESHQKIDHPGKSRYPLPTCENAISRPTLSTPSRESLDTLGTGTGEQGNRGTGEQGKEKLLVTADAATAPRPLRVDSERVVSEPGDPDEPDPFDDFWSAYPRKVGKGAAIKAWRAATKKADAIAIMRGLERFQFSTDAQFIPHPTTWLNSERWADETNIRPIRPVLNEWDMPRRPSTKGSSS